MTFGKHGVWHLLPNKQSGIVTTVIVVNVAIILTTNPQMLMLIPDCVLSDPDEDNIYMSDASFNIKYVYK